VTGVLAHWLSGWQRVWQARGLALGAYAVTFALALPLAVLVRDQIETQLGGSLTAAAVADGVNYDWWTEFTAQATGLGATVSPSMIGFASTLDSLSRVLDARTPPTALLWFLGAYLTLWTFLAGGIIDRYARQRPTRAYGFFGACGTQFFRLARLAILAGVVYWALFHYLHSWLFLDVYRDVSRGLGVERTAFFWRLLFYALFGSVLLGVSVVADYARIRLVVEDRRSAVGALRAAVRFLWRNPATVAALYLLNGLTFVLIIALWSLIAPGVHGSGVVMWIAFLAGQVYLLARLALKLQFLASQTALFQASLAHATYTAAPAVAWPDSPAAELITR
jgi:hypothetical protein